MIATTDPRDRYTVIGESGLIGSSFALVDQWARDAPAGAVVEEDGGDDDGSPEGAGGPEPLPEECRTCMWFAMGGDPDVGECRAEPPKSNFFWPKVYGWHWCREWEPIV